MLASEIATVSSRIALQAIASAPWSRDAIRHVVSLRIVTSRSVTKWLGTTVTITWRGVGKPAAPVRWEKLKKQRLTAATVLKPRGFGRATEVDVAASILTIACLVHGVLGHHQ